MREDAIKALVEAARHAGSVLRNPHMEYAHRLYAADTLAAALRAFDASPAPAVEWEARSLEAWVGDTLLTIGFHPEVNRLLPYRWRVRRDSDDSTSGGWRASLDEAKAAAAEALRTAPVLVQLGGAR